MCTVFSSGGLCPRLRRAWPPRGALWLVRAHSGGFGTLPARPFRRAGTIVVVLPVLFTWLYRRLGRHYPGVYLTAELQTAFGVTLGTLALLSFYWEVDESDFLTVAGIAMGLTAVAVALNLIRTYPRLRPIKRWIAGERSEEQSAEAWRAAVGLPADLIRRDMFLPFTIVVAPSCAAAVV